MGFMSSSSVATGRTTRFKGFKRNKSICNSSSSRQMMINYWNSGSNPECAAAPPATPFNNTSFLIQLQQRREVLQAAQSIPTFDQYGSMESLIASCSFAATSTTSTPTAPPPRPRHPVSGSSAPPTSSITSQLASNRVSNSQITDPEPPHGKKPLLRSDSDELSEITCPDSDPRQLHSCSGDAVTCSPNFRPKLEDSTNEELLGHGAFLNDNFEAAQHNCADSSSQTGSLVKR